jgi:radical SAM additional 4Fe4S-binding domain
MRKNFSAPVLADISLTNRCNLKCEYCYASAGDECKAEEELTLDKYKELFKQLDDMNVHRISLSGGEPFVRNDFFDILNEAQKYKFAIVINSNGTLISEAVSRKLREYRFDRICITIDGSCSKVHDIIRGKGTFLKAIQGIRNLQKYNLPVSTLFTLNKTNIDDLINTIKLNESLGIEYMSVMVMCPTGRASNGELLITKENWYPIFLKLTQMKSRGEIKINFKIVPPNEGSIFWLFYYPLKFYDCLDLLKYWNQDYENCNDCDVSCQAGIKSISIMCNGDVYGCDLMIGIDEFCAGSFLNSSINDIWNNSKVFKKLRNLEKKNLTGKCHDCENIWCGGGCRSAAYNLDGSIYGSDLSCFGCEE